MSIESQESAAAKPAPPLSISYVDTLWQNSPLSGGISNDTRQASESLTNKGAIPRLDLPPDNSVIFPIMGGKRLLESELPILDLITDSPRWDERVPRVTKPTADPLEQLKNSWRESDNTTPLQLDSQVNPKVVAQLSGENIVDNASFSEQVFSEPLDRWKVPEERVPEKGPRIEVENRSASPEFVRRIQNLVNSLPEEVRAQLASHGVKIVASDLMSTALPDLKGRRPRGYPPGMTWDNTDGLFDDEKKLVVITENVLLGKTKVLAERPEGALLHEIGHALDRSWDKFSDNKEFTEAYEKDVAALKPEEKAELAYMLQAGRAGRCETFAEVMASLNSDDKNRNLFPNIQKQFPTVTALLKRQIELDRTIREIASKW